MNGGHWRGEFPRARGSVRDGAERVRPPSASLLWKRRIRSATLVGVSCAGLAALGAETDFTRYGIILERKPFGREVAVAPAAAAPVVPPEKSVVNQIRMSAVIRDKAGTLRVGLIDVKSNRNYLLGIGESMDDIEVVSADYARERARLRRGAEDYWVSMAGGSNRFERADAVPAEPVSVGTPSSPASAGANTAGLEVDQKLSYAKRRQQREEARLRAELERLRALEAQKARLAAREAPGEGGAPTGGIIRAGKGRSGTTNVEQAISAAFSETNKLDLSDAEIAQMLQEYQKELIRSGQNPLPIQLTPESDQQLVDEGFLPPAQ